MSVGEIVFEGNAVWANNAPQNTVKNLDVPHALEDGDYEIVVRNPSAITDLAVSVAVAEAQDATFGGGATRYPVYDNWVVAKNNPDGVAHLVRELPLGSSPLRVAMQNSTVLGAADTFQADVRVHHTSVG